MKEYGLVDDEDNRRKNMPAEYYEDPSVDQYGSATIFLATAPCVARAAFERLPEKNIIIELFFHTGDKKQRQMIKVHRSLGNRRLQMLLTEKMTPRMARLATTPFFSS